MSRYSLLDDINFTSQKQVVRLIKKYNITLLNLFPQVLENIMHEYVNDILNVTIQISHDGYKVSIKDQYINCEMITCMFTISFHIQLSQYYVRINYFSYNIASITSTLLTLPHLLCCNKYMEVHYNIQEYFASSAFIKYYYQHHFYTVSYKNNTLECEMMSIKINNHRLFKNCLVCIKTILNAFNKKK